MASDDDYGREKPRTVDFYHGASAAFDSFRQDKILLTGPNGASENGRGTYFTDTRARADGWSGRSGGDQSVVFRISIDEDTVKNNFIPHDRVFKKEELADLAAHASLNGHYKAAESFAQMSARENPVTGKDLASYSKYDVTINETLGAAGYKGFTYYDESWDGKKLGNIVFFEAKDIPLAMPVMSTTYDAVMKQEGKAGDVPPALKDVTEKLQQAIADKGQSFGIAPDKITAAQENIGRVAKAAAAMGGYDASATIHPLKHAEIALVVATGTLDLAKAVRKETEEFVTKGMDTLGHSHQPMVFQAPAAGDTSPKSDSRYADDRTTRLFHEYLQDPKRNIASEELRSARYEVLQKDPSAQKQLDEIIMRFHSPGLGGNDGFSMRNSLGVGLKELARGQITPEDLVTKIEKAAYFANVDMKQYHGNHSLSEAIGNFAKRVSSASPQPAQQNTAKPQLAR